MSSLVEIKMIIKKNYRFLKYNILIILDEVNLQINNKIHNIPNKINLNTLLVERYSRILKRS